MATRTILDTLKQVQAAIWALENRFEDRKLFRNTCHFSRNGAGYVYPTIAGDDISLEGEALLIDADRDSYLHAVADDQVELVLAGAAGQFDININGAVDFSFDANVFTGLPGSSMVMDTMTIATGSITDTTGAISFGNENLTTTGDVFASEMTIDDYLNHAGDANTYLYFTPDRAMFYIGGKWLLDMNTVAVQDYVKIGDGTDVDINLNDDLTIDGATGAVTIVTLGLGVVKSSAAGLLTSSAIVNGDLGNIGTADRIPKFAATGFADSVLSEAGGHILIAGAGRYQCRDANTYLTSNNANYLDYVAVTGHRFHTGNMAVGATTGIQARLHVAGGLDLEGGGGAVIGPFMYVFQAGQAAGAAVTDSEFAFFVAGHGSGGVSSGPYFTMRGNAFSRVANERGAIFFAAGSPATPLAGDGRIEFYCNSTAGYIDFKTLAISRLTVATSGTVSTSGLMGVATATPKGTRVRLHVQHSAGTDANWYPYCPIVVEVGSVTINYLNIRTPTNGSGGVLFSDPGREVSGLIDYSHTNDRMDFYTNALVGLRITSGQQTLISDGTAALPGLSWISDPNTGFYNAGADTLGIATSGVLRWSITSAGILRANGAQTIDASNTLTVVTTANNGNLVLTPHGTGVTITTKHIQIDSDAHSLYLGDGQDMTYGYDGTYGQINSSVVAPSDIRVTCGAGKTIELQNAVYDDINFSVGRGKIPGANFPNWAAFCGDANNNAYQFAVGELIDLGSEEMYHWWKEGTVIKSHVHIVLSASLATGDEKVQFRLYYSVGNTSGLMSAEGSVDGEYTVPNGTAVRTHLLVPLADIDLAAYDIGACIICQLHRIAKSAGGTELVAEPFAINVGLHCEKDTMGSRTLYTK